MERIVLANKPLVEAIFDVRWRLDEPVQHMLIDPHYKIALGRAFDRLNGEYPYHEQLPASSMPDELAGYKVQHRFRKGKNAWPLVQMGPGILTVNDTDGYVWEEFEKRIEQALEVIFDVYPGEFEINSLLLRYIDAIHFDFVNNSIFEFLEKQMKTSLYPNPKLFEDTQVHQLPTGLDLRMIFSSSEPKGEINMRLVKGKKEDTDALIWETQMLSVGDDAPKEKGDILTWVNKAHELTDAWFFKTIEGELLERFK